MWWWMWGVMAVADEPTSEGHVPAWDARPATAEWDAVVRAWILEQFDANQSGELDQTLEISSVPCEVWTALHVAVEGASGLGLRSAYGLGGTLPYGGAALGIFEPMRQPLDASLVSCGIEPNVPPHQRSYVFRAPRYTNPLAIALAALPNGGSAAWRTTARGILLSRHDRDGSGSIDTTAELGRLDCEVWQALDGGIEGGLRLGLDFEYGEAYRGAELGFDDGLRGDANRAAAWCDLPGTWSWMELWGRELLAAFDTDRSGLLDKPREVKGIDCATWFRIDAGIRRRHGVGVRTFSGLLDPFEPEMNVAGADLHLHPKMRRVADRFAVRCGLE